MSSGRRRRRGTVDEMVTIYWRDIPAQVTTSVGGDKGSWLLSERFQVAIDRAAGVAGLIDADEYVHEWRRVSQPFAGDPEVGARAEAERLEAAYDRDRVRALVANGGLEAAPAGCEPPPPERPGPIDRPHPESDQP